MAFLLPHLRSGWAVDQAILTEEERLVAAASSRTLTQGPDPLRSVLSCEASADEKNESPEAPERFLLRTPILVARSFVL